MICPQCKHKMENKAEGSKWILWKCINPKHGSYRQDKKTRKIVKDELPVD